MTHRDETERMRITAYMGAPDGPIRQPVVDTLCAAITRAYGGVSVSRVTGFWARNGDNASGPYDIDGLAGEEAVKIDLLLYADQTEDAIALLKTEIGILNARHHLKLEHIHVETSPCRAFHFRLD